MKIIKINTPLNLKSGIQIPSGAVVVLDETLLRPAKRTVIGNDTVMPLDCSTLVFASQTALVTGKSNISDIADFDTVFSQLSVTVADYESEVMETVFVNAVKNALAEIFDIENVEVIDAV